MLPIGGKKSVFLGKFRPQWPIGKILVSIYREWGYSEEANLANELTTRKFEVIVYHVTYILALEKNTPRRGIEPRSTTRQAVILATKLSRMFLVCHYMLLSTLRITILAYIIGSFLFPFSWLISSISL